MKPDVIVVGSGFAGAISAARLAEQGAQVLILERGIWRGPPGEEAPDQPRRAFPRGPIGLGRDIRSVRVTRGGRSRELMLNREGLFEIHRLGGLSALTVSGVGGGSLVYLLLVTPDDDFFDAYPSEITAAEMSPFFGRVRSVLRPQRAPHLPEKNRVFKAVAAESGAREVESAELGIVFGDAPDRPQTLQNAVGVAQQTCTYLGECVLGCPRRAKASMDLTYLPLALQHGAELRTLADVTRLERHAGAYRVRYRDRETGGERYADAPRVVLAAGALNTLRLLFLARDRHKTLPQVSPALGHGFSANGDAFAFAWNTSRLSDSSKGPNGGGYLVRRDVQGRHRYVLLEGGLALGDARMPRRLKRRLAASTFLNTIGRDRADAVLTLQGDRLVLERNLDRALFEDMHADLHRLGALYGAAKTFLNEGTVMTAHPMGGAAIADTPADGVVAHNGEVFGCPGLYVFDGAAYPKPPGVPPSLTIAALAERQVKLLAAELGR